MSAMFHYLPEENIIPSGFQVTDLDWTLVSWDMAIDRANGNREFVQFILGPGMLLARSGIENFDTWFLPASDFKKLTPRKHPGQNMVTFAQRMTNEYFHFGHYMVSHPYAFTVDPDNYSLCIPHDPYPHTVAESIGEVLISGYEKGPESNAVTEVIKASCIARHRHLQTSLGLDLKETVS